MLAMCVLWERHWRARRQGDKGGRRAKTAGGRRIAALSGGGPTFVPPWPRGAGWRAKGIRGWWGGGGGAGWGGGGEVNRAERDRRLLPCGMLVEEGDQLAIDEAGDGLAHVRERFALLMNRGAGAGGIVSGLI